MAKASPHKVTVVLDHDFGDRLSALDRPVWIVDSPANKVVAQAYWCQNPIRNCLDGITTFQAPVTTSAEDTLIEELPTVDLHHGFYSAPIPYTILEVLGTSRTPKIETAFAQFGFDLFEDTTDGFRATRSLSASAL